MLRIPCWVYTGVHSGYNRSSVAFFPRKGVYGVYTRKTAPWWRLERAGSPERFSAPVIPDGEAPGVAIADGAVDTRTTGGE